MMRHIVCFKLKEPSVENCEKAREILLSMGEKVPLVQEIAVGVDFLHSARSYDLILQVTLNSREDLEPYQNDPYHVGVVKAHMHQVAQASIAIDYDL